MTKVRMIVWDMDGTMADLYGVDGWLEMLRAENPLPYEIAKPMWDMERLVNVIRGLQDFGIEQRIVTWLSMNSSIFPLTTSTEFSSVQRKPTV